MSTTAIRQFPNDTFSVLDKDGEAHLVAFDENAVYGVELAFPESDNDTYRVNLVRNTRHSQGIEVEQRLTLAEYASQMEAEEHLGDITTALYEQGREVIAEHLPSIQNQAVAYTEGYMVASYPPDAVFTGELASVSLLALHEGGLSEAKVGENLSPHEASLLSTTLEQAQSEGSIPLLLATATEAAYKHGQLEAGQPLFTASPNSPTFYLDQREVLERDAEVREVVPTVERADVGWGWHEGRFTVLPPIPSGQSYQTVLLDVYHNALTGDLAGSYLPLGQHDTLELAQSQCDQLEAAAFEAYDSSADWGKFAEKQVQNPQWHSMEAPHYDLYERLAGREQTPDLPTNPELEPLLADALRLGAVFRSAERSSAVVSNADLQYTNIDREEQGMANSLKAERVHWQVDLNEHVTYLPPHVAAEYRSPENVEGIASVRLQPQGDASMYGFEVSSPNEAGDVTLAALKTFESDILQKEVTESAVLKTYRTRDYDESVSYLDPRSEALSDARTLVYEWGRQDIDHAMGSALLLAQDNGFKGDSLFENGPMDTFTIPADARPITAVQSEREWEREAEHFGTNGYKIPLSETVVHAQAVGRYGVDTEMTPGLFYGVAVRESTLEGEAQPTYIVEGVKAWLEPEQAETHMERVTLGLGNDRAAAINTAEQVAQGVDVVERLEKMEALAHDLADHAPYLPETTLSTLQLNLQTESLFQTGPLDPGGETVIAGWGGLEERLHLTPVPTPSDSTLQPLDYQRTIGEAAYHQPLEAGQSYEFRMRPIPDLESEVARYGVDALAVETVKHWHVGDEPQQEVVTLGIHYDRDEARREVDTYGDLAESEGIQAAMTSASAMADIQNYPDMVERAEELELHINPEVRFGELFKQGPPDPFLPERELQAETPPPLYHELSIEVVPVQNPTGQPLGQAVVALDAEWDHQDMWTGLEQARSVTAYEVAHFDDQREAGFYAAALHEYCFKRDLDTEGAYITPALDFLKEVQSANGLEEHDRHLDQVTIAQVKQGEWVIQQSPEDFHPLGVEPPPALPVTIDLER